MKAVDELVVGLVGSGHIGSATAEMLSGLVGQILAFDPANPPSCEMSSLAQTWYRFTCL